MELRTFFLLFAFLLIWNIGEGFAQVLETVTLPPVQKTGGMSLMEALQNRQSQRSFSSTELSLQQISDLLWSAYGINRPNGYRTVPWAKSHNEFDIYIIKPDEFVVFCIQPGNNWYTF